MRRTLLVGGIAAVLSIPLSAQQASSQEVVFQGSVQAGAVGSRGPCGSGSTTTLWQGATGQAGNMWDIIVSTDMTIECLDFNLAGTGPVDLEIWYCATTCVGNEINPTVWTQLASVTGIIPAGLGLPTPVDISGNGVTFSAGQSYGIYAFVQNYTGFATGIMWYTNSGASNLYLGDHCDVQTQFGSQMNWLGIYSPREWNGTLYTEVAGPAGPALAQSGTCGGVMTFDFSGFTPGGPVAIVYGPAIPYVHAGPQCAGVALDLTPAAGPIVTTADGNGDAQLVQAVPAGACGALLVQAADVATCIATNSIAL